MTRDKEVPYIEKQDPADRNIRRFIAFAMLFLLASAVLWLIVAPTCKDIYTDFGSPLPRISLVALTSFINWGHLLLIGAAVAVVAVAVMVFSMPRDSQLRRYAWLVPAAGLTIVLIALVTMVFPVLSPS